MFDVCKGKVKWCTEQAKMNFDRIRVFTEQAKLYSAKTEHFDPDLASQDQSSETGVKKK